MRIADPFSRELMAEFRNLHNAIVTGNADWWSCSCGKGSQTYARTQAIASHGKERHLRAAHKRFIREKEDGYARSSYP